MTKLTKKELWQAIDDISGVHEYNAHDQVRQFLRDVVESIVPAV